MRKKTPWAFFPQRVVAERDYYFIIIIIIVVTIIIVIICECVSVCEGLLPSFFSDSLRKITCCCCCCCVTFFEV